ncbi:MAG: hypothetical protein VYB40_06385, partial [Candidatus Thermoplasmatota archaeon]|nr:hypothetical protein [Candidatus Thermoplasmatota archaeon]
MLAGCLGGDEQKIEPVQVPMFDSFALIDSAEHDDPRNFTTIDLSIDYSVELDWAVFGNEEGGNCCEHYLVTTKEGWIVNFGG